MNKLWILIVAVLIVVSCTGKSEDANKAAGGKIKIVTTIGMIADAAENIGGDLVDVTALMGPGIDPHLYKASAGDVRRMSSANIILYGGLHLEGKMTEVFAQMNKTTTTVAVSEKIDPSLLLSPKEFEGLHDPHVWFDVGLWKKAVERIGEVLAEFDSKNSQTYRANTKTYLDKLTELDAYVRQKAGELPPERRVLITAHDAFNYFGRAYGFEVRGIQGISTASEAGTADVERLANFIKERQIPAIFVETSVPQRYVQALQAAVKSKGFDVAVGGSLFSDSMGDEGTEQGTYPGMIKHNIDTIVNALKK